MNRGGSGRHVFPEGEDAAAFHEILADVAEQFGVEFHAYCLMGTHYHLLLRTRQPNLSRAMRHLDGVFTQRFHRRHGTDGALFRGRYKAILVQAERHLVAVSRYIHLNPVEAGLAGRPEDWPFSSYNGYLDWARAPSWLHTKNVLACFGSIGARIRYRRFVEQGIDPGTRDFYGRPRLRPILGDDEFRERIRQELGPIPDDQGRELPDLRFLVEPMPLGRIAAEVRATFGVDAIHLTAGKPPYRRQLALARGAFVLAARRLGGWRLREIAAFLGYRSYDAAWRAALRFRNSADNDPALASTLAAIVSRLAGRSTVPAASPVAELESDVET